MVADLEVLLEVAVEQHGAAARALGPQIVGDLGLLRNQSADFGSDVVGNPVHGRYFRGFWGLVQPRNIIKIAKIAIANINFSCYGAIRNNPHPIRKPEAP